MASYVHLANYGMAFQTAKGDVRLGAICLKMISYIVRNHQGKEGKGYIMQENVLST